MDYSTDSTFRLSIKLLLVYIALTYWVAPLYLLIVQIFDIDISDIQLLYGKACAPPLYLVGFTFLLLTLRFFSKPSKSTLRIPIIKSRIDLFLSVFCLLTSAALYFSGNSSFRYLDSSVTDSIANLGLSIFNFVLLLIYIIRLSLFRSKNHSITWYLSTCFYIISSILSATGLASALFIFAWIYMLFTVPNQYSESLLTSFRPQKILFDIRKLFSTQVITKRLITLPLALIILFTFTLTMVLWGESTKVSRPITSIIAEYDTAYFARSYLLNYNINRPEYYSLCRSPELTNKMKSNNLVSYLDNVKYRFGVIIGQKLNSKGEPPPRTNLLHIAQYKFRQREGTTPGLLGSASFYFPGYLSILFETLFAIIICFFVAKLINHRHYSIFDCVIIAYFVIRPLLQSPFSVLSILDETFILFLLILVTNSIKTKFCRFFPLGNSS